MSKTFKNIDSYQFKKKYDRISNKYIILQFCPRENFFVIYFLPIYVPKAHLMILLYYIFEHAIEIQQ